MARSKESLLNRILRRGEDAGMLVSAAALILVEAGYVAWLERLPALPSPAHPVGFVDLPPWYEHPRAEVTLLLTVLGGVIAWAALGVCGLMRNRSDGPVADTRISVKSSTPPGEPTRHSYSPCRACRNC
jgi:hypothetical protein